MISPVNRSAFSLVELLVAVSVLAALFAVIMPGISSMMQRANLTKSSSNLRQIGAAMASYASDTDGYLPPANGFLRDGSFPTQQFWWPVHLLPYTGGETKIFDRPGLQKEWNAPRTIVPETGRQFRMGYWINGGNDPNVAFCHSSAFIDQLRAGKNYRPLTAFESPSRTVALIDGIAGAEVNLWNPDSRGSWRSGFNSKYHRWSGEKVDQNGLNAEGKPPDGNFNVLWLDGHVSLEKSQTLKPEDFLRVK